MTRATVFLIIGLLALAALAASEHVRQNAGAPLVKAAVPMFAPTPAFKLYTFCPVGRRQIETLQERTA